MKKIININLSGRVIPIEDTAYESLQRYIESLRRYFAHEEGRDEIINDIESRIAELMNDKVRKGAGAITDADIEEIITAMGRIEDFEEVDAAENASAEEAASAAYTGAERPRFKGRLYRNTSDKILGGVCSGIANYMNFDPAVVRLLFAIVTFGGFGFGVLIYILLWIILPARDLETYTGKRLFRNPDDRIIAGVAGGLGAYFHQPSWIIRLIFAGPLLLNILFSGLNGIFSPFHHDIFPNFFIGSFSGTFILAYIILWIVLPEAKTPYDKMEMRGETVDVNRIRQNVQDEINQFKNEAQARAKAWSEEVRTTAQNFGNRAREFAGTRGRTFATEVAETARPVASGLGHAIGVLFKAFFLFIAGSIAFGLFVGLIVLIFGGGIALWPTKQHILDFALDGFPEHLFFWGTVLLFFAVPLIAFITWLVRRIFKVRSRRHYLGYTFGGLWLIGIICLIGLISSIANDVRYYEVVRNDIAVTQPPHNRMLVMVNEPELHYGGDLWFNGDDNRGWEITADSLRLSNVKISVVKSDDSNYAVTLWKESRGANRQMANARASSIQYAVSYQDSVLNLGSGYTITRGNPFRGQDVVVEIRVPVGKKIRFDESVLNKLHPSFAHMRFNRGWRPDDFDINSFDYQANTDYTMTATGSLISDTAPTPNNQSIDNYQYHNNDDLQQQYEEQKRKTEEEQQRLKELEQQMKKNKAADTTTAAKEETTFLMQSPFALLLI